MSAAQSLLQGTLPGDPERPILLHHDRSWRSCELAELANRFADELGVLQPGTLLAIWLPNGAELLALYLACFKLGVVPMPLAPGLKWPELERALQLAHPDALVLPTSIAHRQGQALDALASRIWTINDNSQTLNLLSSTLADTLSREVSTSSSSDRQRNDDEAACLVLHTSGSTGQPKGVVLPRRAVHHILHYRLNQCGLGPDSVSVVASCAAQSVGLYQCLALLAAGAFIVLLDSYDLEPMVHAVNTHQPTHLIMVVSAFDQLLHHPELRSESLQRLRFAAAGADRVTARVQARFQALTGHMLVTSYGLSESSWALINDGTRLDKALALGKPGPEIEIQLRDPTGSRVSPGAIGEIHIKSPRTLLGYLNDPTLTSQVLRDGWLSTGDLAQQDADGYFWFAGRSKDLIVLSSGDNVAPAEVEQLLATHPAVAACLVVGKKTPEGSEVPWAFVVPARPVAPESLQEFLKQQLSDFKVPARVELVSELPRGLSGKIQRGTR
jgi:long-chain acyl-CoA synthetase